MRDVIKDRIAKDRIALDRLQLFPQSLRMSGGCHGNERGGGTSELSDFYQSRTPVDDLAGRLT